MYKNKLKDTHLFKKNGRADQVIIISSSIMLEENCFILVANKKQQLAAMTDPTIQSVNPTALVPSTPDFERATCYRACMPRLQLTATRAIEPAIARPTSAVVNDAVQAVPHLIVCQPAPTNNEPFDAATTSVLVAPPSRDEPAARPHADATDVAAIFPHTVHRGTIELSDPPSAPLRSQV